MNSKLLFKKCDLLWNRLTDKTELLRRDAHDFFYFAECVLAETDTAVRQLKSWVATHEFDCWQSEVTFFREIKPRFVAQFIYYTKILSLEASVPYGSGTELKKYYEKELTALEYFSSENHDFINYYRRRATYLDLKYFVRYRYDMKVKLAPDLHSYDERFSTSHDITVAHILANAQLETYMKEKISDSGKSLLPQAVPYNPLPWTASKTSLIELLVALHHTKCFSGGRADLAEVMRWAERSLDVDLGNYHKTIGEIRNRKTDRTKFTKTLHDSLNRLFDDLDGQ